MVPFNPQIWMYVKYFYVPIKVNLMRQMRIQAEAKRKQLHLKPDIRSNAFASVTGTLAALRM